MDLTTKYAGLTLRSPIIVGSSGLTYSIKDMKSLEDRGAGALVLKSIFEEEIFFEHRKMMQEVDAFKSNLEFLDYYDYKIKEENISKYMDLIRNAKKQIQIPVIASINCMSSGEWVSFARQFEEAGADALELNVFVMPSDFSRSAQENEKVYFDVIEAVKKEISIPLILKMSYYFSHLGQMILKLSQTGVAAIVLFNRFFSPDIDIKSQTVVSTNVLSTPAELPTSLRWIAIMADRVDCDLAASTGIHDGNAVIKQLLAGASAVQVASAIYNHGAGHIEVMLKTVAEWMESNGYGSLDDFRGNLSQSKSDNPALYERVQFMRYFSDRDSDVY
jgi:dihydroorotate dehydrogenase (fumarate)